MEKSVCEKLHPGNRLYHRIGDFTNMRMQLQSRNISYKKIHRKKDIWGRIKTKYIK